MLSESTRARLGGDLPLEDLGVREINNVEGAVRLYRLHRGAEREPGEAS